jgi:cell division protein FtsL
MNFGLERISFDTPALIMTLLVFASASAVIYTKHSIRGEFVQLQKLEKSRDMMNEEWGRLLLEESTWAGPNRVEQLAKQELNMVVPSANKTVVVKP